MREYRDGPISIQKRSCTDKCCLLLFFLLSAAMLGFATYSWFYGNFKNLTTAYDPDGKGCGVDYPDYPNYPYLYFASPHLDSLWVTVCVSSCPVAGDKVLKCKPNSLVKSCNPETSKNIQIYDSSVTANTVCLPTSKILQDNINAALGSQSKQMTTLMQNYTLILISLPIAILLALVIMVFIRCFASCFIYILILVTVGSLVAFGAYLIATPASSYYVASSTARIVYAVLCFLMAALIFVLMCCLRSRLSLASKIVEVAAVFVGQNCLVVLIPMIMFIITILFIAIWILQALGLYSLGTPKFTQHQYPFSHFEISNSIMAIFGVHVFHLFWVVFFLIETSSFLITGAAASWYYRRESPYSEASERYRWKHMGSVCFGSFLKALIGFIKFLYQLLTPEKQADQSGWKAHYKKFCDCICCICLKIFDWINGGAYTVINIIGDDYCDSALKAASIRLNNLAASSILVVLQAIFSVIVRLGITALTMFVVYIIATKVDRYKDSIQDPTLIILIVGMIAFAISCFFISVYSDAMESIYVTYLVDVEAGGSKDKCPSQLAQFLEQAQKQLHIVHE